MIIKIGDEVEIIESFRKDFEGMKGAVANIDPLNLLGLKYLVKVSEDNYIGAKIVRKIA